MTITTAAQIINAVAFTFISNTRAEKMAASEQKQIFGSAVFGKKDFRFDNNKQIFEVRISTCYGSDSIWLDVTPEMVAEAINTGRKIEHNGAGKAIIK